MPTITKAANAHTVVTTGWTNPSNAFATTGDNVYATAVSVQNGTVNGDFGFPNFTSADIPDQSIINSVTVTVEWGMTASVTGGTLGVQIRNNGVNLGTETTQTSTTEVQATQQVTTGITLSDLRSASTLIKARARTSKGNVATAMTGNLDFITLTVNFTPPKPFAPVVINKKNRKIRAAKNRYPGRVLIQGLAGFNTPGVISFNLPLLTWSSAGSVLTPAVGGAMSSKRKKKRLRAGKVIIQGLITESQTGSASFNLPLLTWSSTGGVPVVTGSPVYPITQVPKKVELRPGRVTVMGLVYNPAPNTGTISTNLPLLTWTSAGKTDGNDLAFNLPMLTWQATGAVTEVENQFWTTVWRKQLKLRRGKHTLITPARTTQATGSTLSFTIPLLTWTSQAKVDLAGNLAITLPLLTWTASTEQLTNGQMAFNLPMLTWSSQATIPDSGQLAFNLPLLTWAAAENQATLGALSFTLPKITWAAQGEVRDLDGSLLGPGPTEGQLFPR